jgi:hypothetical protein
MNEVRTSLVIITELVQYFLQKTFFWMLINYPLNKKGSRISRNKNVYNSSVRTFAVRGVGT